MYLHLCNTEGIICYLVQLLQSRWLALGGNGKLLFLISVFGASHTVNVSSSYLIISVFCHQAYIKIYQGEDLPQPKTMLMVCTQFTFDKASKLNSDVVLFFFLVYTLKRLYRVCPTRPQQRPITWQLWQQPKISITGTWRRWVHVHLCVIPDFIVRVTTLKCLSPQN